jgi:hypothetical protein
MKMPQTAAPPIARADPLDSTPQAVRLVKLAQEG